MPKTINRLGETNVNNKGYLMKIIRYANCDDMTIEFEDGTTRETTYSKFKIGGVNKTKRNITKPASNKKNRIGEVYEIKDGYKATIIEYIDRTNCTVELNDGTLLTGIAVNNLKKGSVKNPNHPYILGKGYYGQGKYQSRINGEKTGAYIKWMSMLVRAYDEKYCDREQTYKDVSVCDEWLNYQNFAEWYENNYYEIPCEGTLALDKDILHKGNKVYSPNNCCFVPSCINNLFIKSDKLRGSLPIGVCAHGDKFVSKLKNHLGTFNTPEEAFRAYKIAKEDWIKELADKYKEYLPQHVYEALYAYEVEITD